MSKLLKLVSRAGLATAAFALAVPAFAQTVMAPDTGVIQLPPDQRLSLVGVLSHAKPLVMLVFAGLAVAIAYAAFIYVRGLIVRRDERVGGLIFLSALAAGGPLIGAFGAAYGLLDMSIGIANKRPSATLVMLAPGFAEAALCITLGLLAGAVAIVGLRHLTGGQQAFGVGAVTASAVAAGADAAPTNLARATA